MDRTAEYDGLSCDYSFHQAITTTPIIAVPPIAVNPLTILHSGVVHATLQLHTK
jgi:hypothetical protein